MPRRCRATPKPALGLDPRDVHTLAEIIPDMETSIGNTLERILADAGYKGHNAPLSHRFKVFTAGQKRRMTPAIKREMKRRAASGYNFRLLLTWLRIPLRLLLGWLFAAVRPLHAWKLDCSPGTGQINDIPSTRLASESWLPTFPASSQLPIVGRFLHGHKSRRDR